MNPAVGIDLGTTNTVLAVQIDEFGPRILQVAQPVHQRNSFERHNLLRSSVLFEPNKLAVVGQFASYHPDCYSSTKSLMGTRWSHRNEFYGEVTPSIVAAHVLRACFDELCQSYPDWDHCAAITVPASFNSDQRRDTFVAARLAGFKHAYLLDEPVAAFYLYHDLHKDGSLFCESPYTLVFDFGGGTLDVSIIKVIADSCGTTLDTIGRSRYNNLGGDDVDRSLAAFFTGCWEFASGKDFATLNASIKERFCRYLCLMSSQYKEEMEHYLSDPEILPLAPTFRLDSTISGSQSQALKLNYERRISEADYRAVADIFFDNRNEQNTFKPIAEAISLASKIDPDFSSDKLNLVLYTGGASRMSGVQRALKSKFHNKHCTPVTSNADACETVAQGAAKFQYDRVRRGSVRLKTRLLESIFTRDQNTGRYIELIPFDCVASEKFVPISREFWTQSPLITLRHPLFRGVSATDHQLWPMRPLEIPFDEVVPTGSRYSLAYKMAADKELEILCSFSGGATSKITMGLDESIETHEIKTAKLFKVNSGRI